MKLINETSLIRRIKIVDIVNIIKYNLIILMILLCKSVSAQIEGVVIDSITNKPIPFAHIFWAETDIGVFSDIDGNFMLPELENGELINISCIGYVKKSMHRNNVDSILLSPGSTVLKPVEIYGNDDFEKVTLGFAKKTGGRGSVTLLVKDEPNPKGVVRIIAEIYNTEGVEMILENLNFYLDVEAENPKYIAMRLILSEVGPAPDTPGDLLYNSNFYILHSIDEGSNLISIDMLKYREILIPKEGIHCKILILAILDENDNYIKGELRGVYSRNKTTELKAYVTTDLNNKANFSLFNRKGLHYNYPIWVDALMETEE